MKPPKFLICDCDGVLNRCGSEMGSLMPEQVAMVHDIIKATGAKFILSSSWRKYPHMKARVEKVFDVWDSAPILDQELPSGLWSTATRAEEIQTWLLGFWHPIKFIILDDDPSVAADPALAPYLIATDSHAGLTEDLARQAIRLLQ